MTRREAREQAFVLLFEELFHEGETLAEMVDNATEGRNIEVDPFAYKLAEGAVENRAAVDVQIEGHSTKWKKNRISRVALAILRLAIYEILFDAEIPDKVSINEAVELAKKFGSDEDSSFVNGVLGGVVREKGGESTKGNASQEEMDKPDTSDEVQPDIDKADASDEAQADANKFGVE